MSVTGTPRKNSLSLLGGAASQQEDAVAEGSDSTLLQRMLPFLWPQRALLGLSLALMPLTVLVGLLQPYLLGRAVDAVVVQKDGALLLVVVGLRVIVLCAEFVGRFTQTYVMQLAGQRTVAALRGTIFRHTQRLSMRFFDREPVGRIVTRVTNDVENLNEFFSSGAVTALADLMTLVGIIGMMLWIDWRLSIATFVALPPLVVLIGVFRRFARRAFRDIRGRLAQLNAYLDEQVRGIRVIQAFGNEDALAAEYRAVNAEYRRANHQAIRYDALLYSVVESISVATVAIVLWYASTQAALVDPTQAGIYLGTVVAFYEYLQRFFIPVRELSMKYTIIQSSLASAERIFALLDETDVDQGGNPDAAELGPNADPAGTTAAVALRFDRVSFSYRAGQPVLDDVSFSVPRGSTLAVVGATGSGKTTLTALLLGLYSGYEGEIFVDEERLEDLPKAYARRLFGVVPQDPVLFEGSVLDNICLGEIPDEARAERVLQAVGAWDLVAGRDGGIHTRIEERGQNFSAGESQLLSFARALYRDPPFLLLDEATAHMDTATEDRVQHAAQQLASGRTAIVIAHRLSTIRDADSILVLHRGRVVEQGSHGELLEQNGVYARLHRIQFATPGHDMPAHNHAPS